jgi:hypothetical protein
MQSRQYVGGPQIEYVTANVASAAVANMMERDHMITFAQPHRFIGVASVTDAYSNSGLWIHFMPLALPALTASNIMVTTGVENWLPLASSVVNANAKAEGRFIKLRTPLKLFYFDADHPTGIIAGGYNITFFGTDDFDDLPLIRQ